MKLRDLRKRNGLTQSALASKVGVTRVTIARIEAGTRIPSPDFVKKVMKEFELSIVEAWRMFYGEENEK